MIYNGYEDDDDNDNYGDDAIDHNDDVDDVNVRDTDNDYDDGGKKIPILIAVVTMMLIILKIMLTAMKITARKPIIIISHVQYTRSDSCDQSMTICVRSWET